MLAGAEKLQRLRRKLVRRIIWAPLFDVRAWVNDWSTALLCIWELFAAAPHRHHQLHLDLDATTGGGAASHAQGGGGGAAGAARRLHVVGARPRRIF